MRDYRIVLSNQDIITGGSAFNVKAESLRLGNFSKEEIHELYMQHTRETGQHWDEACFPMVWESTEGQPWLVNALAREVTWSMKENRDRSVTITPEMLFRAKENLIYRRDTHIDQLIDKLKEPRVKRIIEPMLSDSPEADDTLIPTDDLQYVEDMGLIKRERGKPRRIANSIYQEVIDNSAHAVPLVAQQDTARSGVRIPLSTVKKICRKALGVSPLKHQKASPIGDKHQNLRAVPDMRYSGTLRAILSSNTT